MIKSVNNYNYEKLKDQFTSSTRLVRRNLLVSSSLSITLIVIGDTSISSIFGIKFNESVPVFIPQGILFVAVLYEFIAFITYAVVDHKSWYLKPHETVYKFSHDELNLLTEKLRTAFNQLSSRGTIDLKNFDIPVNPMPFHIDPIEVNQDDADSAEIEEKVQEFLERTEKEITDLYTTEYTQIRQKMLEKKVQWEQAVNKDIELFDKHVSNLHKLINKHEAGLKKYQNLINTFNLVQIFRIYFIDWGIPLFLGVLSLYLNYVSALLFIEKLMTIF